MRSDDWLEVPVGLDADRWVTRVRLRTILVVAHSVTALQRLLDITPLFEVDQRMQVVFTQGPGAFSHGVDRLISNLGAVSVSWKQATRTPFDLALASGYSGLHELHSPVVVVPHGVGFNKFVPTADADPPAMPVIYGLNAQQLVRDGRVVPSVIGLSHDDELSVLAENCAEAVPHAAVLGDPCLDRILVSRAGRPAYRAALGLAEDRKLLVISSTWGRNSLFGRSPLVLERAMAESVSHGFTVALLLHPGIWYGHGLRQVRQWLSPYLDDGLLLLAPDEEWRAALISADWVIGDHGSATLYASAAGAPVLHTEVPRGLIVPGSAMELLHATTPTLHHDDAIYPQLRNAADNFDESLREKVMQRTCSAPGEFAALTSKVVYDHLDLPPPRKAVRLGPVALLRRGDTDAKG